MKKTSKEILKTILKNQELILNHLKIEVPKENKEVKKAVKTVKTKNKTKAK